MPIATHTRVAAAPRGAEAGAVGLSAVGWFAICRQFYLPVHRAATRPAMAGLVALRAIFRPPMRLLVVVPALNEERALPLLLDELPAVARAMGCELAVVVIDDGSTD